MALNGDLLEKVTAELNKLTLSEKTIMLAALKDPAKYGIKAVLPGGLYSHPGEDGDYAYACAIGALLVASGAAQTKDDSSVHYANKLGLVNVYGKEIAYRPFDNVLDGYLTFRDHAENEDSQYLLGRNDLIELLVGMVGE